MGISRCKRWVKINRFNSFVFKHVYFSLLTLNTMYKHHIYSEYIVIRARALRSFQVYPFVRGKCSMDGTLENQKTISELYTRKKRLIAANFRPSTDQSNHLFSVKRWWLGELKKHFFQIFVKENVKQRRVVDYWTVGNLIWFKSVFISI